MSELRQAVWRAAKGFKGGIGALAEALSTPEHKVNAQTLRNRLSGNDRHDLDLAMAEEIIDLCDSDALAHAEAMRRGGVFIKAPADGGSASDMAVLELIARVWRSGGDVGKAVEDTLADHRVEKFEVAKVRTAVYAQQAALIALVQRMEEMAE